MCKNICILFNRNLELCQFLQLKSNPGVNVASMKIFSRDYNARRITAQLIIFFFFVKYRECDAVRWYVFLLKFLFTIVIY